MFRLERGVSGRPSTDQGTAEEEPFCPGTTGPSIGGRRNLVRPDLPGQSGFQIASNSAGVDRHLSLNQHETVLQ